jgi:hypothetical protein
MDMHGEWYSGDMASVSVPDRQLRLVPLQVQHVRAEWPFIAEHLQRILKKTKEAWIPEDVYASLIKGESACLEVYDNLDRKGVLVVRKECDDWSGKQYLFVWCVSLENGLYSQALSELAKFAEAIGVKSIRGESPRIGWGKRAKMISAVYEVTL